MYNPLQNGQCSHVLFIKTVFPRNNNCSMWCLIHSPYSYSWCCTLTFISKSKMIIFLVVLPNNVSYCYCFFFDSFIEVPHFATLFYLNRKHCLALIYDEMGDWTSALWCFSHESIVCKTIVLSSGTSFGVSLKCCDTLFTL